MPNVVVDPKQRASAALARGKTALRRKPPAGKVTAGTPQSPRGPRPVTGPGLQAPPQAGGLQGVGTATYGPPPGEMSVAPDMQNDMISTMMTAPPGPEVQPEPGPTVLPPRYAGMDPAMAQQRFAAFKAGQLPGQQNQLAMYLQQLGLQPGLGSALPGGSPGGLMRMGRGTPYRPQTGY